MIRLTLSTITELDNANTGNRGQATKIFTEGCVEEALIKLNRDNDYTGETFNFTPGDCTVSISGTDNDRTLTVYGEVNDYFHNLSLEVTLSPFTIETWN